MEGSTFLEGKNTMKESEDIAKLFALFDGDNARQYREVHEDEQNNETRERWPLFKRVPVGSQVDKVHEASAIPAVSLSLPAAQPANARVLRSLAGLPQQGLRQAEPPLAANPPHPGTSSLQSLFSRLQNGQESTPEVRQPVVDTTTPPSGSIRSLFDRLRQP